MSLNKTRYNVMVWEKSKARTKTYKTVTNIEVSFEMDGKGRGKAV